MVARVPLKTGRCFVEGWLSQFVGVRVVTWVVACRLAVDEAVVAWHSYMRPSRMMKQPEHSLSRWLRLAISALLFWTALFLFGNWCLYSTNIPTPPLALPLPSRLLSGLGLMLYNPFSLIPLTLILAASGVLALKLRRSCSAAITLVCLAFVILGAFWVPNPILLWPFSVLGEHSVPELIGELFTFHIVPAPEVSYGSSAGFDSLFRWQLMEIGARLCVLIMGWTIFLVAMWRIDRRLRGANPLNGMPGSEGKPQLQIGLP